MFAAIAGQSWATATHPYNLEINGTDYIAKVQYPSIDIEMAGPGTNGSMTFTLEDSDASVTVNEWDEVRFIEHAATRPILFGGFVQSVRFVAWAANGRSIEIQCVGYGVLLDKKVWTDAELPTTYAMDPNIQRAVSLFGGIVTAQKSGTFASPDETYGIPAYSTLTGQRWLYGAFLGSSSYTPPEPSTLRAAIEWFLDYGMSESDYNATVVVVPVPGMYWVDSARMFRLLADGSASSDADWQSGGADFDGQWDGGTTALAFDTAGTYTVEGLDYEREDSDRATSAYVAGGSAVSTGFYRGPAMERAGDLETIISDSSLLDANDITTKGAAEVQRTTAATARGSIVVSGTSPIDIWPGRMMTVDASQVGLSSATNWRAVTVSIAFRSWTDRAYTIGFGGNAPAPSAMRRMGRFAIRS